MLINLRKNQTYVRCSKTIYGENKAETFWKLKLKSQVDSDEKSGNDSF